MEALGNALGMESAKSAAWRIFKPRLHADCVRHLVARSSSGLDSHSWPFCTELTCCSLCGITPVFPPQSRKVVLIWGCKLSLGVRMTQTWFVMTQAWGSLDSNLELTFKTWEWMSNPQLHHFQPLSQTIVVIDSINLSNKTCWKLENLNYYWISFEFLLPAVLAPHSRLIQSLEELVSPLGIFRCALSRANILSLITFIK